MKKKVLAWVLVLAASLYLSTVPRVKAAEEDFWIENGVLISYDGSDSNVVIPKGVTTIGEYAFEDRSIRSVTIPSSVTRIEKGAFAFCNNLREITIPDSVISLGTEAFYSCGHLTRVTLSSRLRAIPSEAFAFCSNLTDIEIPGSVTSLGFQAFCCCHELTDLELPVGLSTVEKGAFDGCYSLKTVKIPSSVTYIGEGVFVNCDDLIYITVDPENANYKSAGGALFNKAGTELIQYPVGNPQTFYSVPEGVSVIHPNAFQGCTALTGVFLPASLTRISDDSFDTLHLDDIYYGGTQASFEQLKQDNNLNWLTSFISWHILGEPIRSGTLGKQGQLSWELLGTGRLLITRGAIPQEHTVFAVCYGKNGSYDGFQTLTSQNTAVQLDRDISRCKLIWLNGDLTPQCQATTVSWNQ